MATVRRIGFGTIFELENDVVGIGTDAATHTLQALGNIRSEAATDIGISTFSTYQGFVNKEARLTTGQIDIQSQSGATSGEIVIDGDVTVSSATTFTSGPQNLTVTDTFTLPSGDTNSREEKPTPGSLRFNQDFATLEFYTGNNWAMVNTFTEIQNSPGNRGRAIFSSASDPLVLDFVNITTLGNARVFGNLSDSRRSAFGCASSTRGLWGGGGTPSRQDVIDYVTIASEGDAVDFGNLIEANTEPCATSSSTRGIWCGGYKNPGGSSNRTNVIQYVEISTLGNALDFGDITVIQVSQAAASSPTRAIFSGGYQSPHQYEMVTIASKGNAVRFGDMAAVRARHDGCSNGTRAVFGGGRSGGGFQIEGRLEYITIASEGNGIEFGTLSKIDRNMLASASNKTRGLFAGGYDPNTSPTNSNVIDFITFSSLGNAQDFGDLIEEKRGVSGLSDSHGGLGGF